MGRQRTSPKLLNLSTLPLPQRSDELPPILFHTPHTENLGTRTKDLMTVRRQNHCPNRRQGRFLERVLDGRGHREGRKDDLDDVQVGQVLHAFEERREDFIGVLFRERNVCLSACRKVRLHVHRNI